MGRETKIQWAESSWNPWHGCKKISAGCRYCYMYRDKERWAQDPTTVLKSKNGFNAPLKWPDGKLIFTCSWSDWFIEEADEWRPEAWEIIKNTPHHTYQILTKRPERILQCLPKDWGSGYPNVWLGVSVENDKLALDRIEALIDIPAKVKFLSCEPLIGPISFRWKYYPKAWRSKGEGLRGTVGEYEALKHIDWIIVGGESGSLDLKSKYRARPCKIKWIEEIIIQATDNAIPVFVKQLGTYLAKELKLTDRHGGDIDEFPPFLQIREMPIPVKRLNPKRQKEMDEIVKWFLDEKDGALVCISDPDERSATAAKILSRLACLQNKLTDHIK